MRISRPTVLSLFVLLVVGLMPALALTPPPASAIISGNVLSGTQSAMWQTNSEVDALAMANGVIYAGGKFTSVRPPGVAVGGTGQVNRTYLAAFSASTGALLTTFNVTLNNRVESLAVSPDGSRLYIGGFFTTVNGATRNRLAAVNPSTGALITAFNPNPNRGVTSIAATDQTVYFGGDFTTVRSNATTSTARGYLASVSAANGWLNTAFAPVLAPPPPVGTTVQTTRVGALALAPNGSRLLAGGNFRTVDDANTPEGPVDTGGMVSLDPVDGALETWNANNAGEQPINTAEPGCGGRVTDILAVGDKAYVTAEGDPPGCYEGTYSADIADGDLDWNSSCLGASQGLAYANGILYKGSHQHDCAFGEGGAFGGYVGGTAREAFLHRYLVGQDVRDGSFVHWSPNTNATSTGGTTSVGPQVMASDGRQVVVGGDFSRVGGILQQGLTRYQPNGDTATPEVPGRSYNGDPWPETVPYTVSRMPVTVQPTAANTLTVQFPAVHDPDTGTLTYRIYRYNGATGGGAATLVATRQAESWHWTRPVLRFNDTGRTPGTTYSYRVDAYDGFRASARSTAVAGTVRTTAPASLFSTYTGLNPATWWRLGDAGPTAADSSAGAPNPGTAQGVVAFGEDGVAAPDDAVTLNGTSGYVASGNFNATAAFSESAWFKTTTGNGGVLLAHSSQETGTGGTTDRVLAMDNNGALVFGLARTGLRNQGPVWNDGEWHHAVATYDGSGDAALYVDGALQVCTVEGTVSTAGCAAGSRLPTTAPNGQSFLRAGYADLTNVQLVFGRNYYARRWPRSDFFNGSLDEVTLFDRALTQQEVAAMFAAGIANTP